MSNKCPHKNSKISHNLMVLTNNKNNMKKIKPFITEIKVRVRFGGECLLATIIIVSVEGPHKYIKTNMCVCACVYAPISLPQFPAV